MNNLGINKIPDTLRTNFNIWLLVYFGSTIYFGLLTLINVGGAADKNMLSIFNIDEFAVYDVVTTMLQGDLRHFLDLTQHVYGYLYHFLNAVALTIMRPLNHMVGLGQATFDVLILRQLSALYYLVAVILLLKTFLRQAHPVSIVLAWFALITLPAALSNNTWLHPDNLVFLLYTLAYISLVRDRDALGKWFWIAAVFWGLAINTKMYGIFLFPVFAYYCFRKQIYEKDGFSSALARLVGSGIVAVLIYLLTTPFLYFGNNFHDFIKAMTDYSATYITGSRNQVQESKPLLWYRTVINEGYFHWSFLFCLVVGISAYVKTSYREALILLVATLPMPLHFLFNVSWTGLWYLIPTLVPIMMLAFFFPAMAAITRWQKIAFVVAIPLMTWQLAHNFATTMTWATTQFHKEESSKSIALYRKVEQVMGARIEKVHTVFRDPYVYIPAIDTMKVKMKWGLANYGDIRNSDERTEFVDLVVLQRNDYVNRCSNEVELRKYLEYMKQDFSKNSPCIAFYSDAKNKNLKGYHFLVESEFGMAFVRSDLQ